MNSIKDRLQHTTAKYLISLSLIGFTVVVCYLSVGLIDYHVVALILLLVVSILAMLFDIYPVLLAAILSALIWNYFFIPPTLTFHIGTPEDGLLFLMYFVIAMINIVLTSKIRSFERRARDKEEREKTIRLYNTLLNSLSHELRTPISTIIGAVDTIKENENKLTETNKKELFDEIEIAGFRLNRQVGNLLNMSRLEAGVLQPKLDWCDLNELIFRVIKNNNESAINHNVHFEHKENLPLFKIDGGLIEQVLNNILYNAIQYTPPDSTITITVSYREDNFEVVISDNGPGIPPSALHSVFDKFYRVPQTFTGGTGLGLSIAKGFTEALNGTIRLENVKEGGSKFTVILPAESLTISNDMKNE